MIMEKETKKYTVEDAIAEVTGTERIDVLSSLLGFNETVTVAQARDIANLFANNKTYQLIESLQTISHFNLANTDLTLANVKITLMKNIAKIALGEEPDLKTL